MPRIRCRFYDDSGAPIHGGCRKGDRCDFVHPSHPLWPSAPPPRTRFNPDYNSNRDRKTTAEWAGRANKDTGSGRGNASPNLPAPSGANAISPPTAPRRLHELGNGSPAGWGPAPIGGTAWSAADDNNPNLNQLTTTASNVNRTSTIAAQGSGWGAPTGGGWGTLTSADTAWGVPAGGGWAEPSASAAGPSAPSLPAPPVSASPVQQSPTCERPEDVIWPKGKGKEPEIVHTPQFGLTTPQYGMTTPRTPRSPNRSPERNPVRKPSGTATASLSEFNGALSVARELRKDEAMRLSSWGVYVPTSMAGPDDASLSTTQNNPFTFPQYTPAEKMQLSQPTTEDGSVVDVQMDVERSSSPASNTKEIPTDVSRQWKEYTHTLAKAIQLHIELKELEKVQKQEKNLHCSTLYTSASLEAVHAKLYQLESRTETKIKYARKYRDECIEHLMLYPLDGLPPPHDNDPRQKDVREVRKYMDEIKHWMVQIQPVIDQFRERLRVAQEERQLVEAENERTEDEQEAAGKAEALATKQLQAAELVPSDLTRNAMTDLSAKAESLQERITNLEYEMDELLLEAPSAEEAMLQRLAELGYSKPLPGVEVSPGSEEDGEVPFEPPPPPKSNEELTEDCEKLQKELGEYKDVVARGLEQMEEWRQRNFTKERSYHELAADNARLNITVEEIIETQQRHVASAEKNDEEVAHIRALLERYEVERPHPPPPPPTVDEINAHVMVTVLPKLRAAMQQSVGKLKDGVDATIQKQQAEVCEKLFPALHAATRIVQNVKHLIERQSDATMRPTPPLVQSV